MNAPVSPQHLTPELHEALGRVTLDENTTRSVVFQSRYKYTAGPASVLVVERGAR